ncbi:putative polygalacturonase [Diplonema papillatum]|nr:putative polygalacturonase [Diplonema papillatum]
MSPAVFFLAAHVVGACVDPRQYGATPGGREHVAANTRAIQRAFDGGGCVTIAGGDYYAGDLLVRADTRLTLAADGRLLNTINVTKHALLYIENADNVTIDGTGEINGRAEDYVVYYDPSDTRLVPSPPDGQRPRLVLSQNASNLVIRDVRIHNASDWTVHLVASRHVLIDNVDIYGDYRFPNNDGIDPDSCTNVTIVNSRINVGDDGICPKATAGQGTLSGLVVRNCTIRSKSHAIKFGSPTDEDMYDILFDNITIYDSNSALAVEQRSNGSIWNVTFSNFVLETRYSAPGWWGNGEWLTLTSEPRMKPSPDYGGSMHSLRFVNITGRSENGGLVSARGSHGSTVSDVHFENIDIVFDQWSNYTTGALCLEGAAGANIPCMGSFDFRPSGIEDSSLCEKNTYNYCRTPSVMRGIHFVNAHGVTFRDVAFTWSDGPPATPAYWGNQTCIDSDSTSTGISDTGVTCNKRT